MSAGDVSIPEAVALDAGVAADVNAGVGGAHRPGAAAVVTSDRVLVDMARVLQAKAQAGVGSMRGGAEFVIVDDDGGGDVDGLEG